MDKSYNDSIRPLLDLADRLTVLFKGTTIKIPRIASCGMQSHGKSSTLESITHISLPKGDGTVTICPIKISLRNTQVEEFARIKFELDSEEKYEKISLDEIADKIEQYQNQVKMENNVKENQVKLFDKVIQVEVNRKNAPNLTLYDMPGLNFNKDIRKESEAINEKYLKEKETTVLLTISGSEEVNNCYVTDWMKRIPDYQKRFNAIITKADFLKNKAIDVYLGQIKSLNLERPPSLIINKFKEYEDLSYEEMEQKELELINQIPNIDKYPYVNKGMQSLINQLVKIQKEDLYITFQDIASKVRREIEKNEKILKELPSQCESQKEFFEKLEECLRVFKEKIKLKKKSLDCNKEDGKPKENLLKYNIQLRFKEHIKKVKIKVNELLSKGFCNQVTNNIIQSNSDNIPTLEDIIQFKVLLKPKIIEILSGFDSTINDIYDMMINNMIPIIEESFGYYKPLEKKIKILYKNYSLEQKTKMTNFYDEIKFLETENISTFNNDLNNKLNTINKEINFYLFGDISSEKRSSYFTCLKGVKDLANLEIFKFNIISTVVRVSDFILTGIQKINENEKENSNKDDEKENKIDTINSKENEDSKKNNIIIKNKNIKDDDNDQVLKSINDLNNEIEINNKYDKKVKDQYKKYSNLAKSLIQINYNFEKEKNTRSYDDDEFEGRIKIAYRPQDIGTYTERITDEEVLKIEKDGAIIYIPGFRYIKKDKLDEFKEFITKGDVEIRTANIITKMVSYLEIMLNRVLDMIFLSIQKYLYDSLIDDKMVCHLRNGIHILGFEKCKKLVEIKPELGKKRTECINNIKNLKKALKEIDNLKSQNNVFVDDDGDEEEEDN